MDTLSITTIVGMVIIWVILIYAYIQTKREIRKEREMYGEQDEFEDIFSGRIVSSTIRQRKDYDKFREETDYGVLPTMTIFTVSDSLSQDTPTPIETESNSFSGFGNGGDFGGGGSSSSWDSSSTDSSSSFD